MTGVAVFDTSRTFRVSGLPLNLALLGITEFGPTIIAEGPPGTIWFGGFFGVWRFRDGRYEEISSSSEIAGVLAMAVDRDERLWVVQRLQVQRFDGQTWTTVLCPYLANSIHRELSGLHGIAIEKKGSVWIGSTVYGEPKEPWEHEGAIWVVDQERKKRGVGPPMAPLFEFDGKSWRAFGPPHGLNVKWAIPELDEQSQIFASTNKGYVREGETWKRVEESDVLAGKRWILRKKGFLGLYAELLFRDGERLVEVLPTNNQTGAVLDLGVEQMASLCIAEDRDRGCVWLGTFHGLYRIWKSKGAKGFTTPAD